MISFQPPDPHSWGMEEMGLRDTLKLPAAFRCTVVIGIIQPPFAPASRGQKKRRKASLLRAPNRWHGRSEACP